jgi:adenylate cyclase
MFPQLCARPFALARFATSIAAMSPHADSPGPSDPPPGDRKLAAVMFTDVVGYSAMVALDDAGTLRRVAADLATVREQCVAHRGTFANQMGDGAMLTFDSAIDAVACATRLQERFFNRNARVPAAERVVHRIGVHAGDLFRTPEGHLAGEAVNIACRLEGQAPPGGICMSQTVRDLVRGRLSDARFGGTPPLKNIDQLVGVWLWEPRAGASAGGLADRGSTQARTLLALRSFFRFHRMKAWVVSIASVGAVVSGFVGWYTSYRAVSGSAGSVPPAAAHSSVDSIVLAVAAPSGRPAPETRALIGEAAAMLGRSSSMLAIVPITPDQGAKDPDVLTLARSRNADYALASSFEDERTLTLQVLDAASGAQLWTRRLELPDGGQQRRKLLHESIWRLRGAIVKDASTRAAKVPEMSATPLQLVLRAQALAATSEFDAKVDRERDRLLSEALRRSPNLISALLGVAALRNEQIGLDPAVDLQRAVHDLDEVTRRAVLLAPELPNAWFMRAVALESRGEWVSALEAAARARSLQPESKGISALVANLTSESGDPAGALRVVAEAMIGDEPGEAALYAAACMAHLVSGNPAKAIEACERAQGAGNIDPTLDLQLAAAYASAGDRPRANKLVRETMRKFPHFSVAFMLPREAGSPQFRRMLAEQYYPALLLAGLPDGR